MNATAPRLCGDSRLLADRFSEFISAATRLEESYRELQKEVFELRKELEQRNTALRSSLAENEQMRLALQHILESLPCGVLVLDGKRTVSMINPEAKRLLEIDSAPVGTLQELTASSHAAVQSVLEELCEEDQEREFCLPGSGGATWVAVRSRILFASQSGEAEPVEAQRHKIILILRDTTAQRRAEQEREAARNSVALAEISTILAHEIRNPLASLELFAGLIAEDPNGSGEWISHLRAGIRLLTATVNNVLRFHSLTLPHMVPVQLSSCLRKGVEFVRPIADQAGISLSLVDGTPETCIAGDESSLQQVILNLACNAIRHTPAGGQLTISAAKKTMPNSTRAVVRVTDTGCGIRPEHLERIFDAGFSGTGMTPGLGLAVCKRIVEQHGGHVRAFSRLNEGTSFELEFAAL